MARKNTKVTKPVDSDAENSEVEEVVEKPTKKSKAKPVEEEVESDSEEEVVEKPAKKSKGKKVKGEKKERKPRAPVTLDSLHNDIDDLVSVISTEIEKRLVSGEKGVRSLQAMRKRALGLKPKVDRFARNRGKRTGGTPRSGGFNIKYSISPELAAFLQVDPDTKLSRVQCTRAVCVWSRLKDDESRPEMLEWAYLNKNGERNLQDPKDKKRIIPDKALSKLLDYKQYQKDVAAGKITTERKDKKTGKVRTVKVTDDSLHYFTIQSLISKHLNTGSAKKMKGTADDASEMASEAEDD